MRPELISVDICLYFKTVNNRLIAVFKHTVVCLSVKKYIVSFIDKNINN